ncbi:MAG: hypothetical protein J6X85_06955, partial [Ruminococcus sp.]|nr:hypothetical protein [Ruminococcus sp.]
MSKLDDLNKKYGMSSGSEQKEEKKTKVSDKFTAFQSKYGLDTSPSSFDPYASAGDDLSNQVYNTNLLRSDEDRRQLSAREKYAQREDSLSRPSGTGLTLPQTKTVAPDYSKIGELEDSLIEQKKYDKDYKAANKKLEMPQPKWATAGTRDERDARVRQRYRDEQRIRELRDILAKGTPTTPIRTPSVGELEDSLIENKKYGAPVAKDAPTNNYLVGRELTELENKIKQEDARIDERRAAEKLHEYFALTKNDDFEQNSKYDDSDRGFTLYNAVNGDSEARAAIGNEQAELAGGGDAGIGNLITGRYDEKATAQLLPSQKKIFNYLYKTRGAEAAQEYYDLLKSELYQRVREADS